MYHHIQPKDITLDKIEQNLSVDPGVFGHQIDQILQNGYEVIGMERFNQIFEGRENTDTKSIVLTFDDGYSDLYEYLFPIIKAKQIPVTIFLITGLVGVPGYLNWNQVSEMAESGLVYFGNHTWSHAFKNERESYEKEMEISERQLWEKGLNQLHVFAYPYGSFSTLKKEVIAEIGIRLAFTTRQKTQICSGTDLEIPRIRMDEGDLKIYGL